MMVFASANRDERKFDNPNQFDARRGRTDHLGFGHGIHTCAGMYLARLEMNALLKALVARSRSTTRSAALHRFRQDCTLLDGGRFEDWMRSHIYLNDPCNWALANPSRSEMTRTGFWVAQTCSARQQS